MVYYKEINNKFRLKTKSNDYPKIIIDSLNLNEMYSLVESKNWSLFTERFLESLENLKAGGAEFASMTANTAHIVFDEVSNRTPLPLISIVEETCKHALKKGCRNVIIFGTAFTMSSNLYTKAFNKYNINAFVPDKDEQQVIHNVIFPNLQEGIILEEDRTSLLKIAAKMIFEKKADALILACTELPAIIKEKDLDIMVLDTTDIHIDSILNYMIG